MCRSNESGCFGGFRRVSDAWTACFAEQSLQAFWGCYVQVDSSSFACIARHSEFSKLACDVCSNRLGWSVAQGSILVFAFGALLILMCGLVLQTVACRVALPIGEFLLFMLPLFSCMLLLLLNLSQLVALMDVTRNLRL